MGNEGTYSVNISAKISAPTIQKSVEKLESLAMLVAKLSEGDAGKGVSRLDITAEIS